MEYSKCISNDDIPTFYSSQSEHIFQDASTMCVTRANDEIKYDANIPITNYSFKEHQNNQSNNNNENPYHFQPLQFDFTDEETSWLCSTFRFDQNDQTGNTYQDMNERQTQTPSSSNTSSQTQTPSSSTASSPCPFTQGIESTAAHEHERSYYNNHESNSYTFRDRKTITTNSPTPDQHYHDDPAEAISVAKEKKRKRNELHTRACDLDCFDSICDPIFGPDDSYGCSSDSYLSPYDIGFEQDLFVDTFGSLTTDLEVYYDLNSKGSSSASSGSPTARRRQQWQQGEQQWPLPREADIHSGRFSAFEKRTNRHYIAQSPDPDPDAAPYKRRCRKNLSSSARHRLLQWVSDHRDDPYPSQEEKQQLARDADLTVQQVSDWMTNVRKRKLRPYLQR